MPIATINPATRLGIERNKGSIEEEKDADIVLLDKNLEVDILYALGKLMLEGKTPVIIGYFEKDYADISI